MKQPELGIKILEKRKAKGLTQEELVERCNLNVRTLQRIESGEVNPRPYTVKAIAAALEASFSEFQGESSGAAAPGASRLKLGPALRLGAAAGLLYFLLGFLEGPMDLARFFREFGSPDDWFYFRWNYSTTVYTVVKLLVGATYFVFLQAYAKIGQLQASFSLRTVALFLAFFILLVVGYDVVSLLYPWLDNGFVLISISWIYGILSILFGVCLIQLRGPLGTLALLAGLMEVLTGLAALLLFPLAFAGHMAASLLEVLILFRLLQTQASPPIRPLVA